jgi:hypothetical protein
MYLARQRAGSGWRYDLRQSYQADGLWRSRTLCALGHDPGMYVQYPGGNAYFIDEALVARIEAAIGRRADPDALENAFWPFIRPSIRRSIEGFRRDALGSARQRPVTGDGHAAQTADRVHPFDRRRLLLLRLGRLPLTAGDGALVRLLRPLAHKSRDEIEHMIARMEEALPLRECKRYVFLGFDVASAFTQRFAAQMPGWLEPERVDGAFLDAYCALLEDASFRQGVESREALAASLTRYVVMFFDNPFETPTPELDAIRDFIRRHRDPRPPSPQAGPDASEIALLFGEPLAALRAMSRHELARRFRLRARVLHPDTGGDHRDFCRLAAAYRQLLRRSR